MRRDLRTDIALSTFNAFLGVWLMASAFLWKHTGASRIETVAIGLACIGIALLASRFALARWLYLPLAAWMFVSPWVVTLADTTATVNLMAIGTALLLAPLTVRFLGPNVGPERDGPVIPLP